MSCLRTAMFSLDTDISANTPNASLTRQVANIPNFEFENLNTTEISSGFKRFTRFDFVPNGTFNFQGFKNVDIYGIQITGAIMPTQLAGAPPPPLRTGNPILNWIAGIGVFGLFPQIGGESSIIPTIIKQMNFKNPPPAPINNFYINNETGLLKFHTPIKAVQAISIRRIEFTTEGENSSLIDEFRFHGNLIINYKFEGE